MSASSPKFFKKYAARSVENKTLDSGMWIGLGGGETNVSLRTRLRRPVPAAEVGLAPCAASHCCCSKVALGFDRAEQWCWPVGLVPRSDSSVSC